MIEDFIDKNKAWGSRYVDYNPIYLRFLAKDREYKLQTKKQMPGRERHAFTKKPKPSKPSPQERVTKAHSAKFELDKSTRRFKARSTAGYGNDSHTVASTC